MSESAKVDEWMANADNPFKDLWEIIRRTVLNTDPKIEEDIKWGAPTFIYKGNLATFNPAGQEVRQSNIPHWRHDRRSGGRIRRRCG